MGIDFRIFIQDKMEQQNITTYELAKRAGLRSRITLYNYLKGQSDITAGNLLKILRALENFT